VYRFLKRGGYSNKVGAGASVYLAAVLEYFTAEILDSLVLKTVVNAHGTMLQTVNV
jgi:hypothetical protein